MNETGYLNYFSCPSLNKRGLGGRVIVTYEGEDEGTGRWNCRKDPSGLCFHLGTCRQQFSKLVQRNPNAEGSWNSQIGDDSAGEHYVLLKEKQY